MTHTTTQTMYYTGMLHTSSISYEPRCVWGQASIQAMGMLGYAMNGYPHMMILMNTVISSHMPCFLTKGAGIDNIDDIGHNNMSAAAQ